MTTLGGPPKAPITPPNSLGTVQQAQTQSTVATTGGGKKKKPRNRGAKAAAGPKRKSYVLKTQRDLDMSSEEEEEEEDYRKGGYHPVDLGNLFTARYKVMAKLGWGHFSTVWLAKDIKKSDTTVALKIVKSAQHYTEAARDEIKILQKATGSDPMNESCVIHLLDHFEVSGPHGNHVSMVFEKLGCNLLTLIRLYKYKGLPVSLVRVIAKQLVIGVEFLHRNLIIHTDLKPENLLLVQTPRIVRKFNEQEREEKQKQRDKEKETLVQQGGIPSKLPEETSERQQDLEQLKPTQNGEKGFEHTPEKATETSRENAPEKEKTVNAGVVTDGNQSIPPVSLNGEKSPRKPSDGSDKNIPRTPEDRTDVAGNSEDEDEDEEEDGDNEDSSDGDVKKSRKPEKDKKEKKKQLQPDVPLPWSQEELMQTFGDCYKVKIVDLGNACWTFKHFTDDVQTRQYRAPEVILGAKYDQAIDVWSIACIVFELLTGDLLFEPKSGKSFEKNDDHLAQMQELLGRMPRSVSSIGKFSRNFFTRKGELRYIKNLKFWGLKDVLYEKYKIAEKDAQEIADFLLPMLNLVPKERATALQMTNHPWIKDVDVNNFSTAFRKLPEQHVIGANIGISATQDVVITTDATNESDAVTMDTGTSVITCSITPTETIPTANTVHSSTALPPSETLLDHVEPSISDSSVSQQTPSYPNPHPVQLSVQPSAQPLLVQPASVVLPSGGDRPPTSLNLTDPAHEQYSVTSS